MKILKKFWVWLIAMMPISLWAASPLLVGGLILGAGIIGISVWRSTVPVNLSDALYFFNACWTCGILSDVMVSLSNLLPGIYQSLGRIVIPMSVTLLAVLIGWRLTSGFLNGKTEDGYKLLGNFGTYLVKMALMIGLLLMPMPRFITRVLIEPAVTLGTSLSHVVTDDNSYAECMVVSALTDPVCVSSEAAEYGAFSPNLRHQLTCELANIHQIAGLGMTVGWTMLNMAFDVDYMHKILDTVPVFPNIPLILVGFLILVLYFFVLAPIPLYFLEIFIKLSLDLVMLPLMLMAWMFDEDDFAVFPKGGKTIRQMLDDVFKAVLGIAVTVVFLTFSIMILRALFENVGEVNVLQQAIANNDSKLFMDGLLLRNSSLITVILLGLFMAMFMTMIPQLTDMLFKVKISDEYYQKAQKTIKTLWEDLKKLVSAIKK